MTHIDHLIQRYIDNNATEEERNELMEMIRSDQHGAVIKEKIAKALRIEMTEQEPAGLAVQAKADEIFNRIVTGNRASRDEAMWIARESIAQPKKVRATRSLLLRYAAVILLCLVVGGIIWWSQPQTAQGVVAHINEPPEGLQKVVNTGSVTKQVVLTDGSVVTLEPGSMLYYPEMFASLREVYLVGDAFFEVAKDAAHPFLVYANEVTTKVLGTSFRVQALTGESEIIVAVKTGKVAVRAQTTSNDTHGNNIVHEVLLTPNQQAVYKRKEQVVLKQLVDKPEAIVPPASPKDHYTNTAVNSILEDLSTRYGVTIHYDEEALASCTLISDMAEGEGLFEQLEVICQALGGSYQTEADASITIQASGCP